MHEQSYVVMNIQYKYLYKRVSYASPYYSRRSAKMVCTKQNNKIQREDWVVMTNQEYLDKHDPMVAVYNHITGDGKTPIYIRKSDVGTCVDPSSETYHSM